MNKQKEYHHIRLLKERFFDGVTSLSEEQELYDFYNQHSEGLPEDLEANREIFMGFGAICFKEGNQVQKDSEEKISESSPNSLHINFLRISIGIAAMLLLCFGITTAIHLNARQELARNYEGSYMIVNGQRIDDLSRIKPNIEKALSQASHIEQELEEKPAIQGAEQNVLDNIDDPEEKARIEKMLNE